MIPLLFSMTLISFGVRYAPFLLTKWLQRWSVLQKLADGLPLCILVILVAHCLEESPCGRAEWVGLVTVVATQLAFRRVLWSMSAGVLCHQLIMHL